MVGRTTFVIAHRLHTLTVIFYYFVVLITFQNVDTIFVLKDGKIVDSGSHAELVDKQGFYKTMWDKQQQEATTGAVDYGGSMYKKTPRN